MREVGEGGRGARPARRPGRGGPGPRRGTRDATTPRSSTAWRTASAASSACGETWCTVWLKRRDVAERALQVDLLEGALAEHLAVDLAGQREHRRAVHARVPQAGQQVGRARAGDRQARGRAAGELAVGGRGEGGGALVADADEAKLAVLLGAGAARRRGRGCEWPTIPKTSVIPHATSVAPSRRRPSARARCRCGTPTQIAIIADLDREARDAVAELAASRRSAGSSRSHATGSEADPCSIVPSPSGPP